MPSPVNSPLDDPALTSYDVPENIQEQLHSLENEYQATDFQWPLKLKIRAQKKYLGDTGQALDLDRIIADIRSSLKGKVRIYLISASYGPIKGFAFFEMLFELEEDAVSTRLRFL